MSDLSNRQRQVVGLVCLGRSNLEIALALGISDHTVKQYLYALYGRLRIHSRTELALWACGALPDSHSRMAARGKSELFLQVLGEQDWCKEMALEQAE